MVEQLRCALKAKNVIIEQLEEEKKDAVTETTRQLELRISELSDKLQQLQTPAAAAAAVSSLEPSDVSVVCQ